LMLPSLAEVFPALTSPTKSPHPTSRWSFRRETIDDV
jgi:hypothetical protein